MNDIKRDLRKIGGHRVAATFKMEVANPDPFNPYSDKFAGTVVFNVRGGCFFVDNAELSKARKRIFAEGPVATLTTLELQGARKNPCALKKINIKLSREKEIDGQDGIVFKFVQTTEQHLDILNDLIDALPPVESDVEIIAAHKKRSL